jgi:hypothetical protein
MIQFFLINKEIIGVALHYKYLYLKFFFLRNQLGASFANSIHTGVVGTTGCA